MENTDIVIADTQLLDNAQRTPAEIVSEIKRYLHKIGLSVTLIFLKTLPTVLCVVL